MQDKIGQPIVPGCTIAYGYLLPGRCGGLRIARVLKVREDSLTVQAVDDERYGRPARLQDRKSVLYYPDRIIVLEESKVSEKYRQLLESVNL